MASYEKLHDWSVAPREAVELQKSLRARVRVEPLTRAVETIAGAIDLTLRCDGGYRQPEPPRRAHHLVNALRRGEREPT